MIEEMRMMSSLRQIVHYLRWWGYHSPLLSDKVGIMLPFKVHFLCSNNEVEYEALVIDLVIYLASGHDQECI